MRTKLIIILLIIVISLGFILWDLIATPPHTDFQNTQITEKNIPAKPFTLKTTDGKDISNTDLSGKIIVLNIWATWCVPCAIEFPDLIALTAAYPNDVIFLALSVDENADNIRRFLERFKDTPQPNRIIARDPDKSIARDIFGTTQYPETYIIDRTSIIRRHIKGVIDWTGPEIKADLETLIAETPQTP